MLITKEAAIIESNEKRVQAKITELETEYQKKVVALEKEIARTQRRHKLLKHKAKVPKALNTQAHKIPLGTLLETEDAQDQARTSFQVKISPKIEAYEN